MLMLNGKPFEECSDAEIAAAVRSKGVELVVLGVDEDQQQLLTHVRYSVRLCDLLCGSVFFAQGRMAPGYYAVGVGDVPSDPYSMVRVRPMGVPRGVRW
jgi:hypothetical protein